MLPWGGVSKGTARLVQYLQLKCGAALEEARQVNGPPTRLSPRPKGTPNEFRVAEREERSGTTARRLFIKGRNTHTCAQAGGCVAASERFGLFGQQHGGKRGMKGGQGLSCDSDASLMKNTRCARSDASSLPARNETSEQRGKTGR